MLPRTLLLAVLTVALSPRSTAVSEPGPACHHTRFDTALIKDACAKGGQPLAKATMKRFAKEHRLTTCNGCHKTLAPKYELKPDALERFRKLGGK